MSFEKDFPLALTFDDILLLPQYSEIIPSDVTPKSFFGSRNLAADADSFGRDGYRDRTSSCANHGATRSPWLHP